MAAAGVHIADTLAAIRDGTVPGALTRDRTAFEFPVLSYAGARGVVRLWAISVRLICGGDYVAITDEMLGSPAPPLDGYKAEIRVEAKQEHGKVRDVVPTYVGAGKNLGRKNATNCVTQAIRDALGLYNKQLRRTAAVAPEAAAPEAAAPAAVAAADDPQPPPMLAQALGSSLASTLGPADFAAGVTVQRKLNGVRCVARQAGPQAGAQAGPQAGAQAGAEVVLYSRTGVDYPGQPGIAAELARVFAAAPRVAPGRFGVPPGDARAAAAYDPPGPYLDGELYVHGKPLGWISGQARRADDPTPLEYHVFDVFFPRAKAAGYDMPGRDRQAYLAALFAALPAAQPAAQVVRVGNFPAATPEDVAGRAAQFIGEGYEGAIARKDQAGYVYGYNGYHSANLVKVKPTFDAEFPVVGFTQGTRGADSGAVIWVCRVPNPVDPGDVLFNVVPKSMTRDERRRLFACLSEEVGPRLTRFERDVKGRPLTVEYRELSAKTGKPLQAKALIFRTYEAGDDPIKRILDECGCK